MESPSARSSSRCSRCRRCTRCGCTCAPAATGGPHRAGDHRGAHPAGGRLHGAGVHGVDGGRRGAPVPDLLQRVGQPAGVLRWLRAGRRRAGRTGHQRRVPEPAARRLRTARPLGRDEAGRFHAQRIAGTHCGRGDPDDQPAAGHRLRLGPADQAEHSRRQRLHGAAAVRPGPGRVPVAGSYVTGPQQESLLTSAWYELPRPDGGHPLVVVTAAGTIAGDSVLNAHTDGQLVELEYARPGPDGAPVPAGRVQPYDIGPARPGATCATTAPGSRPTPARCASWPPTGRWAWATGSPSRRRGCRSYGRCRSTSAPPSRC